MEPFPSEAGPSRTRSSQVSDLVKTTPSSTRRSAGLFNCLFDTMSRVYGTHVYVVYLVIYNSGQVTPPHLLVLCDLPKDRYLLPRYLTEPDGVGTGNLSESCRGCPPKRQLGQTTTSAKVADFT